ncbi:MAG: sigma-70 family RNA polymerase sigma factor [Chryseolinea sp.]
MKNEHHGTDLQFEKESSVSLEDNSLWKQFQEGDLEAYAVIYKKYFFVLYQYGRKITVDENLVKDCVQDLFIKIWNNRERLSETTSVKYYLFTCLRNKLLDHLRSNQHKHEASLTSIDDKMIADIIVPDLGEDYRKEKVLKAINNLSEYQQQLLKLKFTEERTNKEISEALGITMQSVYNAVFKTLRLIRKQVLSLISIILINY